MECVFFDFFGMGWGIVQLHHVIAACAAACLLQEKEAAHLKECTGMKKDGEMHVNKLS